VLIPDKISFQVCGITDADYHQKRLPWWEKVYGFDMRVLQELQLEEAAIDDVDDEHILTTSCETGTINLYEITAPVHEMAFQLKPLRVGLLAGLCLTFTLHFFSVPGRVPGVRAFRLATHPSAPPTHWQQVLFYLRQPYRLHAHTRVSGTLGLRALLLPDDNLPRAAVQLHLVVAGKPGSSLSIDQSFLL
jgi:protein arginine N-methyltransferase 1